MDFSFKGMAQEQEILALLRDLVSINSINPFAGQLGVDGNGEAEMVSCLAAYFDREQIPYTIQEVLPGRSNLIARLQGRGHGTLVMEAHMDTVSTETMTIDPFDPVCKDGKLYGRGSCDCKGSVAAMAYAMAMLKKSGIQPWCDILFVGVADEEYRFRGVSKFLADGKQYDGAIIGEPTSLRTCIATKGVIRFFITAHGKPCHSSMAWNGHNAILDMVKLIEKIQTQLCPRLAAEVHPIIGPRCLNITTIQGGELVNIIPEVCRIQVDMRSLKGDTFTWLAGEIQALIDQLKAEDPQVNITIEPAYLEDLCLDTPADEEIVQQTCAVCDKILGGHKIDGLYCGCDASKFSNAGTPALVFGPGDIEIAHTAAEYIEISELTKAAETYAQICADFRPNP